MNGRFRHGIATLYHNQYKWKQAVFEFSVVNHHIIDETVILYRFVPFEQN